MTDAELAILSIVAEGPVFGYDIQTIITQRGLRAWTNIGVSSMYYVLEKLERQRLINSAADQPDKGPSHRQYRITPAGFGVLQTAVADLISTPREHASNFELGLANLHVLRPSQIRTAFIAYRQELTLRLTQTRERWQQLDASQASFNVDAMFDHHIAMLEAERDWVTGFIEQWESQAPPDDSEAFIPEPVEIPRMKQVVLPRDPDSPHRMPTRASDAPSQPGPDAAPRSPRPASLKETPPSSETPYRLESPPDPDSESAGADSMYDELS